MKSYRDQYEIRQGRITLYRRTNQGTKYQSSSWYAAFRIPGKTTLRKSLKTSDQIEAENLAESIYFDLVQKSKRGLSLKSKKFELVCNNYLKDFSNKVAQEEDLPKFEQRYKKDRLRSESHIINKYLIPYFIEKTLQEITDFDIEAYKEFRKTYWTSGEGSKIERIVYSRDGIEIRRPKNKAEKSEPSYGTLNKELTVIRKIFEFARLKRLIQGKEIPTIKNIRKPRNVTNRKSGLTENEIKHLLATLHTRYKNEVHKKQKRHLKLLLHYIAFMCLTGLRVTEAKNIRISDCVLYRKDGNKYLKIWVSGKGKHRELIGLDESPIVLEKIKILHKENSKKNKWKVTKENNLFVDQYGKQVGSFAKSLNRAFSDAGLLFDSNGVKRTAGAFRKYYITQALIVGKIAPIELAKQCGTSVSVIDDFYAEIDVKHTPRQFIFKNALTGVYDEED